MSNTREQPWKSWYNPAARLTTLPVTALFNGADKRKGAAYPVSSPPAVAAEDAVRKTSATEYKE